MSSYYECYFDHKDDQGLWCGMLHNPRDTIFDTFAHLRLLQKKPRL